MELIGDPAEVFARCDEQRRRGRRVGLVPTMGFLHAGHLSLISRARELADHVVVSIFVNPTQFGPTEDLDRYPRDAEGDAAKCRAAGCDLLFVPTVSAMYPAGHQTHVEVQRLAQGACGARRPGHFRGVCTVVTQLFHIVGPCVAVFGEKDYQQLQVIRRMTRDLHLPVQVVGSPTVREPDGLALSSRNAYLDAAQRRAATCLRQALGAAQARVAGGGAPAAALEREARQRIEATEGARVDYVEVRHHETLEPLDEARPGEAVMLLAVFFGSTRLIDNARL